MPTHHILIIDDSSAQRWALRVPLQSEGFKVTEASNGEEALATMNTINEPLSLIITDQNMPEMTGIEMLKILKSSPDSPHEKTPVIVVTSETSADFEDACSKLKVLGIVSKPARVDGIVKLVKKCLGIS